MEIRVLNSIWKFIKCLFYVYFIYFIIERFNGNNVGYRLLIMLEIENNLFYCNYIYSQTYSKVVRN